MRLDKLPAGKPAWVEAIDWASMSPADGQRLREFGIHEGASIELLHRGGILGGGAVAARIGRMTVAMRARHAAAIAVSTGSAPAPVLTPVPVSEIVTPA